MRRDSQTRIILSLGILLFLFLSSCSLLKKEQEEKQTDYGDRQARIETKPGEFQKSIDYVHRQAQMEIRAGEFQKAIDVHREIYQKYPQDPRIRSSYITAIESIKRLGDQAFERNDFRSAGMIYEVLGKNWVHFADFSQSFSFNKDFLEKKIKTCRYLFTEEQLSSSLKTGDFRKAIEIYRETYQKYPLDRTVQRGYVRSLELIKNGGDRAFERRDFAAAGYVYESLLKNISFVKQLNGSFSFDREELTARIRNCEKILFQDGLEKYRSGNLGQAISLWKSILVFDPENEEVKKAVDIATLQLKNLQKPN